MSSIRQQAERFFEACETGKGWEVCEQDCHAGATFSAQAETMAEIDTLEDYTEWMKDLLIPIPDARYEVRAFAEDPERNSVAAFSCVILRISSTGRSPSTSWITCCVSGHVPSPCG